MTPDLLDPVSAALALAVPALLMLGVAVMLHRGLPEPVLRDEAEQVRRMLATLKPTPRIEINREPGGVTYLPPDWTPFRASLVVSEHYFAERLKRIRANLYQERDEMARWADDGGR